MGADDAVTVTVGHDRGSYPVVVGEGALSARHLDPHVEGRRVFVVSAAPILELHRAVLETALAGASTVQWLVVPDGEAAKSPAVAAELWSGMLAAGGKRDSLVVTFGGGSVGDLGGFVAATFLRGVEFVQVPTTFLAQVDASVGGKVAVDLPGGKNTVGAFHQPRAVIADVGLLATEARRARAAGLVESVKMAAVLDAEVFERLERRLEVLLEGDPAALSGAVTDSVRMKAAVVEGDPFENRGRMLLNFGHTLGHAIEVCLGYGTLEHGEAVAHGMRFALRLSRRRGLTEAASGRIESALGRLAPPPLPELRVEDLLRAVGGDKKAREGGLTWVLCPALGRGELVDDIDGRTLEQELAAFLADG